MKLKFLLPVVSIAVLACNALATTSVAGHFTWLIGTLNATTTPTATAQTVSLKVGTTVHTVANTFVCGSTTNSYAAGTPFGILESSSQPLTATFSTGSLIAFENVDGAGILGGRVVPMSTAGVLSANIAFVMNAHGFAPMNLALYFPSFTLGTMNFVDGLASRFQVPVAAYNLSIPATSGGTGAVTFPTGSLPLNTVGFTAEGTGTITIGGESTTTNVVTVGVVTGSLQYLSVARLYFTSGTQIG